jgi:hypothetical protein
MVGTGVPKPQPTGKVGEGDSNIGEFEFHPKTIIYKISLDKWF